MTAREKILLHEICPEEPGVEIGPSIRPLAPKRQGFNVRILDHCSAEELRIKYGAQGLDTTPIEEVDLIWKGEDLAELLDPESYSWILASHVIEHTVDLIGFLQGCERVLKPGGLLSMAIPDKRYCFDHFREVSSLSRIIDVHENHARIQTLGAVAEYFLKVCTQDGAIAWDPSTHGIKARLHSQTELRAAMKKTRKGQYVDIHNWVFTDQSFFDLMKDLEELGILQMRIKNFVGTKGHEFFVILQKQPHSHRHCDR